MRRIGLAVILIIGLVAALLGAEAQQAAKVPRIGLLSTGTDPSRPVAWSVHALRTWLDSWTVIGHVAVGMHRQGFDLQLTQYDDRGWRVTSATGTRWERTPWHAVQQAAWEALRNAEATR